MELAPYLASLDASVLGPWKTCEPWLLTSRSESIVREILANCSSDHQIEGEVAIHRSATIESGAIIKGPAVIGPRCFIAAGAYVRGGCWLDADCVLGPGAELKSSFMFRGSKLAHFNFVGDSILGEDVNLEAGSIVANYRNERADKEVLVLTPAGLMRSGVMKFGALLGDHCRVGANAVIAPGALLPVGTVVRRLTLLDQEVPGA